MQKKENTAFWKAWRRRFCSSKLKPASTINGSSGDENIPHEFTHYFKSIVTPVSANDDIKYKVIFNARINYHQEEFTPLVDINLMQDCVNDLKNNKATGFDGIGNEHIRHGGVHLLVHLCLLFNAIKGKN